MKIIKEVIFLIISINFKVIVIQVYISLQINYNKFADKIENNTIEWIKITL
jgi:hypothetical protein